MPVIEMRETTLDGRKISYTNVTEFLVETTRTKHSKSGYETRNKVVGNLVQAVSLYRSYNIGYGYKKRLVMVKDDGKRVVLTRATS